MRWLPSLTVAQNRARAHLGLELLFVSFLVACVSAVLLQGWGQESCPSSLAPTEHRWAASEKAVKKLPISIPRTTKVGGETEATQRGRQAHKDWNAGEGFVKEVGLPSGKRADAVNLEKREVKELKPDNPRAIKRGEQQVEKYRRELEEARGGKWTGKVETYKR